jgi:hypothetical protein
MRCRRTSPQHGRLAEEQLHANVGAGIGRGWKCVFGDDAKAKASVEAEGGQKLGVGFQIKAAGAEVARQIDGCLQEQAADALSLGGFGDGHFGDFEGMGREADEGAAADEFIGALGKENMAPGLEDVFLRVSEGGAVLGFKGEEAGDPSFVELAEGEFVTGLEGADEDVGGGERRDHVLRIYNSKSESNRLAILAAVWVDGPTIANGGRLWARGGETAKGMGFGVCKVVRLQVCVARPTSSDCGGCLAGGVHLSP